jgi:hypothetical protein
LEARGMHFLLRSHPILYPTSAEEARLWSYYLAYIIDAMLERSAVEKVRIVIFI